METHRVAQVWDWPLSHTDGLVNVRNTNDRFECDLEVPQFKANEIDIKIMKDELVLHCAQEGSGNRMPREVHRTYRLPADIDGSSLRTSLRDDGRLNVTLKKRH